MPNVHDRVTPTSCSPPSSGHLFVSEPSVLLSYFTIVFVVINHDRGFAILEFSQLIVGFTLARIVNMCAFIADVCRSVVIETYPNHTSILYYRVRLVNMYGSFECAIISYAQRNGLAHIAVLYW